MIRLPSALAIVGALSLTSPTLGQSATPDSLMPLALLDATRLPARLREHLTGTPVELRLPDALRALQRQGLDLVFGDAAERVERRVRLPEGRPTLAQTLELILRDSGLGAYLTPDGRVVVLEIVFGTIRGRVRLSDNGAASGVNVRLRNTRYQTVTGPGGDFRLDSIPAGRYVLVASGANHFPVTSTVQVQGNDTVTVNLALGPVAIAGLSVTAPGFTVNDASTVGKTDAPIAELPQSVSVVTQDRIATQKAQSINEALRYSAGVQAEYAGGVDNGYDFMLIRGFSPVNNGMYRDGVQLSTPAFVGVRVEPYGSESIEVVRGAASVLYGQNNPGGMVNSISKRPTATRQGEFGLESGSFNLVQGKFDVSGPFGSAGGPSQWAYRLTGLARNAGNQVEFDPNDRLFLAPALAWHGPSTSFTFLSQVQKDQAAHFPFLPAQGTYLPNPNGFIPLDRNDGEPGFNHFHRTQYSLGYEFRQQLAQGWELRQNTHYDHVTLDFADVFATGWDSTDASMRTLSRAAFTARGTTSAFNVDNQLRVLSGNRTFSSTLLLGADFQHYRFAEADGYGDAPTLDAFNPSYGAAVSTPPDYADALTTRNQAGLYFNQHLKIAGRMVAAVSGRQTFLSSETADHLATTQTKQDDSKFRAQGGLVYLSEIGLIPHLSYAASFTPVIGLDGQGQPFVPETGRQYEAGLRYEPSRGRGYVSAAMFDLRRQNVLTPDPTNPNEQIQTGEVRSRGIELETGVSPVRALNLMGAYTRQDVTVTKSNAGDLGKTPPATAGSFGSMWLDYTLLHGSLAGLGLGTGARFQGTTFGDTQNTMVVGGFTLLDAMARYEWRHLRLQINGQNLLDTRSLACDGLGSCYYGRSRSVVGSLSYKW